MGNKAQPDDVVAQHNFSIQRGKWKYQVKIKPRVRAGHYEVSWTGGAPGKKCFLSLEDAQNFMLNEIHDVSTIKMKTFSGLF